MQSHGPATGSTEQGREVIRIRPLFGDTLIGLVPGTGDTTRRYLGRLRHGYAADTLNVILFGDNRPGWRASRLANDYKVVSQMFSPNPVKIVKGLVWIPWTIVKGLYPDLALLRDIPAKVTNMPTASREKQVLSAVMAKIDSLQARDQAVSAVLNTGDLVEDGRCPAHWRRFLTLTQPLSSRTPYFPIAGNHERTDDVNGVENWRTATGLPVGGDRLYYCFDSADGWMRFIALDTNPIVDPGSHWTRDAQVAYSKEEFDWLVARIKEHQGPVLVLLHHPPFSSGFHRDDWQRDSVLYQRRLKMVNALHESGISVIASGHEHAYQRAVLTWQDAAMIALVTGGAGAPLVPLPSQAEAARLFSEYKVPGASFKPKDVMVSQVYNFSLLRIWFGGGEIYTYAVDPKAQMTQIDKIQVDLKRYGVPKIDQHKIPIPPAKGPTMPPSAMSNMDQKPMTHGASMDTTSASNRLLTQPAPGKKKKSVAPPRPHVH